MLSRFIFLFVSLAFMLFACLPVEHSYVRGGYDEDNLLKKESAYHTNPYQCLVEINGEIDPDTMSDIIHVGNASGERLCLPSNELSYLVKAKKPTEMTTTTIALKIAVLFDSSYSLRKTDPKQKRFDALKTYLLALFDKVESEEIKAREVEVSFFPFKYCSHAKFKTLTITKGDDRVAFETKIDALIGSGNGNAGGDAANKIKQLKAGTLVPKTLKAYGAYGSTNYLQAFAKAKKYLSTDSGAYKNIVIFSDGLPLTYNDGVIATYNKDECTLPKIRTVTAANWQEKAKDCVLNNNYPGGENDACTAPTGSDKGITTGFKAYSDPMNHLLGMIQHSQQIKKAKGDDINVYAVHLKVCDGLPVGEKHLCQNISKPFFESFSEYFPATNAGDIAKAFDGVLKDLINVEYKDMGKVTLAPADSRCQVSSGANTIQGMSKKYDESENFSFLKTQRIIKVGEYKGKGRKTKGKSFYDDLSQAADINLGLPHQKDGRSLTTIKHKAGGEKKFNICIDFKYKDSCVSKNPKDLHGGGKYGLQVHEYKDSHGNNIYCVIPKPIPAVNVTTTTVVEPPETELPEVVDNNNDGSTSVILVDDVNDEDNQGEPPVENPPDTGTDTEVEVEVNTNPPPNTPPNNPPSNPPGGQDQTGTQPTEVETSTNNPNQNTGVEQNPSGVRGRTRPVSVIKVERIGNWHVEY